MFLTEWLLSATLIFAWIYLAFFHGRFWRAAPILCEGFKNNSSWPSICVIVPARNEAEVLPATLPALLTQDYPGALRVVIVNDNSSDDTALVARKISGGSRGKIPCEVQDAAALSAGWAGKLWALDQGVSLAVTRSENFPDFFLFTDADVLHHARSVRELVSKAQSDSLDLASLMVKLHCNSFWERLLIPAYVFFFQKLYPFDWSNDPGATTAAAAGGCMLIRRNALAKIGGIQSIRSAIIDDCALAKAVKKSGGKIWIGLTETVKSLRAYNTLGSIGSMVARTAFTQLKRSWLLLAGTLLGMIWLYLWGPFLFVVGIISGDFKRVLTGSLVWIGMSLLYRPMTRFYGLSIVYSFTLPLSSLLYTGMTFHSAWLHLRGRTGLWKGRVYSDAVILR